ncbi:MAG: DUF4089 domain-containing protein [Betaproteobacteria bacterium]
MTIAEAMLFVAAAARAQELSLTAEQLQRVAAVFARNAEIAEMVMSLELPETAEPAPTFLP